MKNKKTIIFDPKVHFSIHNRKVFKTKMWLITLGLVLLLMCAGVMFTFGAVAWDPDKGFAPKAEIKYWWQAVLVACGALLTVGSLLTYVLIGLKIFKGFYTTQAIYQKTPEFAKAKEKALKVDLYKLKKSDIKWYKKMGYITSSEKQDALDQQRVWKKKCKDNKQKINYTEPKA